MSISKYDSKIDLEYLTNEPENLYLERKDLREKRSDIADEIVGMLNSDGGILVYGITDGGEIQDVSKLSQNELENYRTLHQRLIKPAPPIKLEEIKVEGNLIFIYHVHEDNENIYSRKDSNNVFKRVGSSNYGPLTIEEIDNLKFDKNLRHYEDQTNEDFNPQDLDVELLELYKDKINFTGTNNELLTCRNLAKIDKSGNIHYCNSTILLFSKDPDKYIPSSYVRYVKYSGDNLESGLSFNVTKDEIIRGNIPTLISKTKDFLKATFNDFYALDMSNGTFTKISEYPEEAWLEGIVNAIFHRSYNLHGNCTMIKHFDNRLEISNSGPLPSQVNIDNIKEQRFSRNPRIGRVLYEMGYVRELNEGVKRIYSSMDESKLKEPIYIDKDSIVTLILKNPVYLNEKQLPSQLLKKITEKFSTFNPTKQKIINFLLENGHGTIQEMSNNINLSDRAIRKNLESLISEKIIIRKSEKQRDKNAKYTFDITHY